MTNRERLESDFDLFTIWQSCGDGEGVPESAINIRDYTNRMLEIRQGDDEIVINYETLPELIKVLRHFQKKGQE